jgi:putative phage-type endonuclease
MTMQAAKVAAELQKAYPGSFDVVCDTRDRDAWLQERTKGIGASEAPAILGLSTWGSPLSVYTSKILPLEPESEEVEHLRWGHLLEPVIIDELGREMGMRVEPCGMLIRSVERPHILATLDGVVFPDPGPPVPAEVKTTGFYAKEWLTEGVPEAVNAQLQQQLYVTGADAGFVVVLLNGNKMRWRAVDRDHEFLDHALPSLDEFWQRVTEGEAPDADGREATLAALKRLYPRDNGESVALDGEIADLVADREGLKRKAKAVEDELAEIENKVRAAIGDATFGILPDDRKITYRLTARNGYEVKPAEFRVLRFPKAD